MADPNERNNRDPFPGRGRGHLPRALAVTMVATTALTIGVSPAVDAPTPGRKVQGKGGTIGVGVSLGDPMGASAKLFVHPNHALQLDLGWAPLHHANGRYGLDDPWHPGTFVDDDVMSFLPYLGIGVAMAFWAGRCYGYYGNDDHRNPFNRGYCGSGGAAMPLRAPILGLGFHWKKVLLVTMLEGSWAPYIVLPDLARGDVSFKLRVRSPHIWHGS